MGIGNQILFFLAGLGVFNGLLLVISFFFIIKPKRWINMLFGLLMLMLCIRIGKSLFHAFTDVDRIYLQFGLSACMMIGPFLYLYVKHFLAKIEAPRKSDWIHILVPLLSIVVIGVIWPYENRPDVWNQQVIKLIYGGWFLYVVATGIIVAPVVKKAWKRKSTLTEHWILLVYSCVAVLCISYILAYYGFPYLVGPILFSAVFYILIGFLFSKTHRQKILHQEPIKYQNQKISEAKAEDLLNRLSEAMETQKPYLDHKVKLGQIAKSIGSTPHETSQVINNRLGLTFNQYINEFRIKASCAMLKENDHLTVEGIGQEVGFSSRSAFYKAFKAVMNQTPAQYKSQIRQLEV